MTPARWERLESLFDGVLALPEEEREVFLISETAGDDELAEEVRNLARAHEVRHPLIDAAASADLARGTRIGPYAIERMLGAGGMGTVYLAQRADQQFEKQVAIKLIPPGAAGSLFTPRFQGERQILASFEHPNIARLLDAGFTEHGQPYLVMEFVDGPALDVWCRDHPQTVPQRLELWSKIAEAVSYAHRNLVIHRDLKPGNILVDPAGEPKLVDFGIAKLLEGGSGHAHTVTGANVMTPLYASPEQLSGSKVTTATDIYSLGVVLYEMLVGHHPYRQDKQTPLELMRAALERELPFPKGFPPDLRAILGEALDKDPSRRYLTVDQFVEDVQRYCAGNTVSARRPTLRYRASKFVRRHRLAISVAGVTLLAIVGFAIVAVWQAHRANMERARAERRFKEVRDLATTALFQVDATIQNLPGSTPGRRLLVQKALESLDRLAREAEGDPSLKRELAVAFERVGEIQWARYYSNLGDLEGALASHHQALAIREALAAANPANARAQLDLSNSYALIGDLMMGKDDVAQGLKMYRKSADLRERFARVPFDNAQTQRALATSYQRIGDTLMDSRYMNPIDTAGALENYVKAQNLFEQLASKRPDDIETHHALAIGYEKLGRVKSTLGDLSSALDLYRKELAAYEQDARQEVANSRFRRDLAIGYGDVGTTLVALGRAADGLESYRKMLAIREELAAADPRDAKAHEDLTRALRVMSSAALRAGNPSAATAYATRLLKELRTWADRPSPRASDLDLYARELITCAVTALREPERALPYALRAVEMTKAEMPDILDTLALAYLRTGDRSRAIKTEQSALALAQGMPGLRSQLEKTLDTFRLGK